MIEKTPTIIDDSLFFDETYPDEQISFGAVVPIEVHSILDNPELIEQFNRRISAARYITRITAKTFFARPNITRYAWNDPARLVNLSGIAEEVTRLQINTRFQPYLTSLMISEAEIENHDFIRGQFAAAVTLEDIKHLKLVRSID